MDICCEQVTQTDLRMFQIFEFVSTEHFDRNVTPKNLQKDEVRSDFSNRKIVWPVAHPFRRSLLCDVRLFQLLALNLNLVSGRTQMNETDQN